MLEINDRSACHCLYDLICNDMCPNHWSQVPLIYLFSSTLKTVYTFFSGKWQNLIPDKILFQLVWSAHVQREEVERSRAGLVSLSALKCRYYRVNRRPICLSIKIGTIGEVPHNWRILPSALDLLSSLLPIQRQAILGASQRFIQGTITVPCTCTRPGVTRGEEHCRNLLMIGNRKLC